MLPLQLEADIVKVRKPGFPIAIGGAAKSGKRFGTASARDQVDNLVPLKPLIIVNMTAADNEPRG
jgi:hypothetical protein